jgi:RNA-directed DNA polymerase
MVRHSNDASELWKNIPWRKLRKNIFRLQCRLWKAIRANDRKRALSLQKLILKSRSCRLLAIRQVTQLNAGKKTAGIDGKAGLSFSERLELEETLRLNVQEWKHSKLREIPIPKKDGTTRILKVPNICDQAWQCLVKYALEPAHEATFNPRSYGFRPGRSAHDCQKFAYLNLSSSANGITKRILKLDIEKCFDTIDQPFLMSRIIAPQSIKTGIWKCLKSGINPNYPDQGTPQAGVVSPLLANIVLDGIEEIHPSLRYAASMVFFLKPNDNAELILDKITKFLAIRGLNVKASKTRLVSATDGFDFLGWRFVVQKNGMFYSYPSMDNYKAFRDRVKFIVNNSNYGARVKAEKLSPIVRGWRNYHRYCKMDGSRFSLWYLSNRTFKVFNKESKINRYEAQTLVKNAFPAVPYSENKHINVKGDYSPFNGDIVYWSERESKYDDGTTAKALKKQNHTCGNCGLKFVGDERIHLHHINGIHSDGNAKNLVAIHQSCHQYHHMSKSRS